MPSRASELPDPLLSPRQGQVLQAVVSSYVGGAAPVASETVAALLPMAISSASVRAILAELSELGLVAKRHHSGGRIPTERGLRVFVNQLLPVRELGSFERRELEGTLEEARAGGVAVVASRLLSEHTHQLGFVVAPRADELVLRHVSFVRVSRERVLAILVSQGGRAYQRVLEEPGQGDQALLDRLAASLNERVAGRSLRSVRDGLMREAAALRSQAELLLERALRISPDSGFEGEDLIVATWLSLLDQPEFQEPGRIRAVLEAVEEKERLVALLDRILEAGRVRVLLGEEFEEAGVPGCAVVAAPYGRGGVLGSLGVIGPSRMDYARVIPLVAFMSHHLTEMLGGRS